MLGMYAAVMEVEDEVSKKTACMPVKGKSADRNSRAS